MKPEPIPVLSLDVPDTRTVTIEHITPEEAEVRNSVHRHDYNEIFVFLRGTGSHMIDLEQAPIESPCLHAVEAGRVHQLVRSGDTEGFVFEFTPAALIDPGRRADAALLFTATHTRPWTPISKIQADKLADLLRLLDHELEDQDQRRDRILESYLGIVLAKCANWFGEVHTTGNLNSVDPVARFQRLVEAEFTRRKRVSDYAGMLAISSGHLNDLVNERLGTTASAIINSRVMLEAKRLLLHSEQSLKEVSFALGMEDPAYFSRWFSNAEGCAPKVYRERVRELYK